MRAKVQVRPLAMGAAPPLPSCRDRGLSLPRAREWAHKRLRCATREGNVVALTWIRTHEWDADDWRLDASCRDSNPDLFFPIGTTGVALDQIDAAKEVCTACPVSGRCLEFALATNQEAGVWGATTEEERRKLRKTWLADQRRVG